MYLDGQPIIPPNTKTTVLLISKWCVTHKYFYLAAWGDPWYLVLFLLPDLFDSSGSISCYLGGVYWLEGVGYFVSCLSLSPWTFQGFVLATLPSSPLPPSWGHWCSTTSSIFMCILGIHLNSGLHALYWLSHRPPVPTKQSHWHYFQTHVGRPLWACECGCRFFWHGVIPAWTLRQILLWTRSYTTCRV